MTVYHSIARHIVVTGLVQGVGYRDAMCAEARRLGVAGWVRNRRDGAVEAHLQGAEQAVAAVIAWARRGPPVARVDQLAIRETAPQEDLAGTFERLPSA